MMTMTKKLAVATLSLISMPAAVQAGSDPAAPDMVQSEAMGVSSDPSAAAAPPPADSAPSVIADPVTPPSQPDSNKPDKPVVVLLPAPDIEVVDQSLVSMVTDNGAMTSTPATGMPYIVGKSCYHWAVKYMPVDGTVTLTEELRLLGPARNWDYRGTGTVVNPQGSGAITTRRFNGSTGGATAGWCVAKDDPMGSYRYIIRQGEREIARFDFTVGDLL